MNVDFLAHPAEEVAPRLLGSVLTWGLLLTASSPAKAMTLLDQDWTEAQAQALLDSLNLDGGTPKWKSAHLKRLRTGVRLRNFDAATIDGQLEFVAYELCHGFQAVGMAFKQAQLSKLVCGD